MNAAVLLTTKALGLWGNLDNPPCSLLEGGEGGLGGGPVASKSSGQAGQVVYGGPHDSLMKGSG